MSRFSRQRRRRPARQGRIEAERHSDGVYAITFEIAPKNASQEGALEWMLQKLTSELGVEVAIKRSEGIAAVRHKDAEQLTRWVDLTIRLMISWLGRRGLDQFETDLSASAAPHAEHAPADPPQPPDLQRSESDLPAVPPDLDPAADAFLAAGLLRRPPRPPRAQHSPEPDQPAEPPRPR